MTSSYISGLWMQPSDWTVSLADHLDTMASQRTNVHSWRVKDNNLNVLVNIVRETLMSTIKNTF